MKILLSNFLRSPLGSFRYKSNIVIFRKPKYERKIIKRNKAHVRSVPVTNTNEYISKKSKIEPNNNSKTSENVNLSPEYRENEMKIQMLPKHLHGQVFGTCKSNDIDRDQIKRFDFLFIVRYSIALIDL